MDTKVKNVGAKKGSNNSGGRKLGQEWVYFKKQTVDGKIKSQCKFCRTNVSSRYVRLKEHLKKCEIFASQNRNTGNGNEELETCNSSDYSDENMETEISTETEAATSGTSNSTVTVNTNRAVLNLNQSESTSSKNVQSPYVKETHKKQVKFSFNIAKTSPTEKENIDVKLAKYFYASNTAFRQVESPVFKEFLQALRPGYNPPTRYDLSHRLLDKVSDEMDEELKNTLTDCNDDTSITLLLDGWSSVKNDAIIACSIHKSGKSYLLEARDAGTEKKTSQHCANVAIENITVFQASYQQDIFAVCTDNENKMLLMRELIQDKFPNILTYGCNAHYLNLVEKEVTPNTVMKHVIEIQKYFRNHHRPHAWLVERKGKQPQLLNDTRWNSQVDCIETFIYNHNIYRDIIKINGTEIDASVQNKIEDMNIYKNALDLKEQLSIVGAVLDKFQSDTITLSSALNEWIKLKNNKILYMYKDTIEDKFQKAMEPFYYVAFLTDPQYLDDNNIDEKWEEIAINWIELNYPQFLPLFLSFRIRDNDSFPSYLFKSDVHANKWWKVIKNCRSSIPNMIEFSTFLIKLHSCPASSAAIERIFSTFGHVWSKL